MLYSVVIPDPRTRFRRPLPVFPDVKLSSPLSPDTNSTEVSERTCFTPESSESSERVSLGENRGNLDPSEVSGSSSTGAPGLPRSGPLWISSKTSPDPSVRLMTAKAAQG